MKISSIKIIVIVLLIFGCANLFSQQRKDSLRILFVGNSYTFTHNLPQVVSLISDSLPVKLFTRKSVVGGATLSEHWRNARGLRSKEMIQNSKWDYVVLQDNSMWPVDHPDSTAYYIKLLSDLIKSKGAKPVLYMTWAREKVPQFQEQITSVYSKAAKDNGIILVPAGAAWEEAFRLRPTAELFSSDGSHPSPMGTFLNACVFASVLTGKVPDKLPNSYSINDLSGESVNLMYLDPLDVVFCLKVTKKVVEEYKKGK